MSDRLVFFPNKINNPPLLLGFERDLAIGIPLLIIAPIVVVVLLGMNTLIPFAGALGYFVGKPTFLLLRQKMRRSYIAHWFWTRGRPFFKTNPDDGFIDKVYIYGYDIQFRD